MKQKCVAVAKWKQFYIWKIDCALTLSIIITKAKPYSNNRKWNNERKIITNTGTIPIIAHNHLAATQR